MPEDYFRVLSLDGGGAKGFYTLGILHEIEGLIGCRLHERFDLIFGTSTGSIIAALLALGHSVDEIHELYKTHVVTIMEKKKASEKSLALAKLADEVFTDKVFADVKTNVGIVTTKWATEKPMIFKGNINQAHGRQGTWAPGFGVKISDAVQASCSAFPFFETKTVTVSAGVEIELIDGGYCANNPTLYAIADAMAAMKVPADKLRVVSLGVGSYPEPKPKMWQVGWWANRLLSVRLLQKTLGINTESMDQLREILFNQIETVRISDTFQKPEMATDIFEHDMKKLNLLRLRGMESFASREATLKKYLL
ncbi:Phospholipase, patatin family [Neorhizobium galegae bv. officinalis bv. officinalis str. HAMBI 1141]|jgi:patatin-like phospholipase/acyl hydrolase|uniref:Phospholipase, patatin family n=1 Tax=Neorhizobium galegae bv. officinalis bv. officinalis str. HAMBI 1141 TaxID=1028801 RepID=A0A068T9A3_NEOGA|nr:patatin-like phospholipase family protein [Neorhizobium galegae]CDN54719.1 Phospholipase, patatin family [Neorhizobium galegae bv. officinalis bv. officinalis str. HAMBI 1141]